jgi:TolA-binding protein
VAGNTRGSVGWCGFAGLGLAALAVALLSAAAAHAQLTPDQAADLLLNSARRAYNAGDHDFAAARFREFLAKYGNHPKAAAARYGLALALLDGPARDYAAAAEQLQPLLGNTGFPHHAFVLYYSGLARRGLGIRELEQARPQDLGQRRVTARRHFEEAGRLFATAARAFAAKVKDPDPNAKALPGDLEWAARARCDQAEMQIRADQAKEARDTAAPFLQDRLLTRSRYRGLGLYYHGYTCVLLKDYRAAGRSLRRLAPFTDPVYGGHARFLLARTYQLQGECDQAATHYAAVVADYAKHKKEAAEALDRPDEAKGVAEDRARLRALARGPAPDFVVEADLFLAELLYDQGKYAEAAVRLAAIPERYPGSKFEADARLRQGFCQVRLGRFADAVKMLQPLADKEPRLADQALLWIGKAQAGAADPKNPQSMNTALDTLRQAAQRAQQLAGTDPEAQLRRGEILLELARTQQQTRQYREAAATYGSILGEKLLPRREDEVLERQAAALQRAGDYAGSDQACQRFRQAHAKSPLLPAVLLLQADNARAALTAAENNPNLPDRVNALARLTGEATARFQEVIDRFPETRYANPARFAQGLLHYRRGDYVRARKSLEAIDRAQRKDGLTETSYLLADCLLRLQPDKPRAARRQLEAAAGLLGDFLATQPEAPQAADALLKLGLCHQRRARLLAPGRDRNRALAEARAALEKLLRRFPRHALQPRAVYERARCLALGGEVQKAVAELRRFTTNPLKVAPVAPAGVLRLAELLRGQGKAEEAARLLEDCRRLHEQALLKDPQQAGWAVRLQLEQALALREDGKLTAARDVLDGLIKQFPNRPETAEAVLYRGQTVKDDALARIASARRHLARAELKPQELAEASKQQDEGTQALKAAVQYLVDQANQLKLKNVASAIRARLLYEAAWGCRELAGPEIAAARAKVQENLLKQMREESRKDPSKPVPAVPPEVAPADVPLQPSEEKARVLYRQIIDDRTFGDLPLAGEVRLELAELHAQRGEHEPAIKLMEDGIGKDLPAELADRLRIRLGTYYAARKDLKAALAQFEAVARDPRRPGAGQAQYQAAECLLAAGDPTAAAERLAVFRDEKSFQNLPGLTDLALLRLGHVYGQLRQWDKSRQAYELVVARFGGGPWAAEARYGIGYTWQVRKEYDKALAAYARVTAAGGAEVAARAQLQIGLCLREQKRYGDAAAALLVATLTSDSPEGSAASLCEAARTLALDGKGRQAERLLQRAIKDYPRSQWAAVAREQLKDLKRQRRKEP